jgi:hypothetical protein
MGGNGVQPKLAHSSLSQNSFTVQQCSGSAKSGNVSPFSCYFRFFFCSLSFFSYLTDNVSSKFHNRFELTPSPPKPLTKKNLMITFDLSFSFGKKMRRIKNLRRLVSVQIPYDHLLLNRSPNIGPLISRGELDKFKNFETKALEPLKS